MKKFLHYLPKIIFWFLVVLLFVTGGLLIKYKNPFVSIPSKVSATPTASPSLTTTAAAQSIDPKFSLVYPIANFKSKVTLNGFGNQPLKTITAGEYSDLICPGQTLKAGYHTAADAEIDQDQINADVPVYSIADGVVREAKLASGYGAIIVIQYNIGGNDYTALYGHINIATFKVQTGAEVKRGDQLALLGTQCSPENGNVRKHLHFAIHKGTIIDIRGYVSNQTELGSWIDPLELYLK